MDNNVNQIGRDNKVETTSENFRNTREKNNNYASINDKAFKVHEISFKIYNSKQ